MHKYVAMETTLLGNYSNNLLLCVGEDNMYEHFMKIH